LPKSPAPLAVVAEVGFANAALSDKRMVELMDAAALEEKMKMERFLSILGTMGNIAPFIGLFGTVVGIIRAFGDLAVSGSGGPSVVAAGIAEALITTAAGLVVAIPAVIFYNYFLRRVGNIMVEVEATTIKLRVIMAHVKSQNQPATTKPEASSNARPRHAARVSEVAAI
jgi:biopolymer transport protein ExbB